MKKVLVFGSLPPPIGGVRVFVKYLVNYFRQCRYHVDVFPGGFSFLKYDVAYINYSSPAKRFVASLMARLLSGRCVMILHSSIFDMRNPLNFLAAWICSGVVTTSGNLKKEIDEKFGCGKALLQSGLLYREFLKENAPSARVREQGSNVVLFYQHSNDTVDGRSVYGADIMLDAVRNLPDDITVVWVDLSGEMENQVRDIASVRYFSSPLDQSELFEKVDLLVRPTAFDGTAFMIVEALSRGVSVLCSDVVSRPQGAHTFSLQETSSAALAEYIKKILSDKDERIDAQLDNSITDFVKFSLHR